MTSVGRCHRVHLSRLHSQDHARGRHLSGISQPTENGLGRTTLGSSNQSRTYPQAHQVRSDITWCAKWSECPIWIIRTFHHPSSRWHLVRCVRAFHQRPSWAAAPCPGEFREPCPYLRIYRGETLTRAETCFGGVRIDVELLISRTSIAHRRTSPVREHRRIPSYDSITLSVIHTL